MFLPKLTTKACRESPKKAEKSLRMLSIAAVLSARKALSYSGRRGLNTPRPLERPRTGHA